MTVFTVPKNDGWTDMCHVPRTTTYGNTTRGGPVTVRPGHGGTQCTTTSRCRGVDTSTAAGTIIVIVIHRSNNSFRW